MAVENVTATTLGGIVADMLTPELNISTCVLVVAIVLPTFLWALGLLRIPRWILPAGISGIPHCRVDDVSTDDGDVVDRYGVYVKYYDCGNEGDDQERPQLNGPTALRYIVTVTLAGLAGQGQVLAAPVLLFHWLGVDLPGIAYAIGGDWRFVTGYVLFSGLSSAHGYYKHCASIEKWKDEQQAAGNTSWDCQPGKELSPKLKQEAIFFGTLCAGIAGVLGMAAVLLHMAGGYTMLYFDVADYGIPYYILSWFIHFLWIETFAYTSHVFFHQPFIYKYTHKWHHAYQPPPAFSAVAFHPGEFSCYVLGGQLVFLFVPIHPSVMLIIGFYTAVHLIEDHTSIKKTPVWPWQPTSFYHDDHHSRNWCNYGQHVLWYDYLFGTLRKPITRKARKE